jgi:protein-disulfide isomerase
VSELGSAPLPEVSDDDHVFGTDPRVIVYADYECPFCAVLVARLTGDGVGWVFRHFPVKSKHPRAWAAACAAEAAGLQGRFVEMHESLYADQGRLEIPHLWDRARALGLGVERFESDRRSVSVEARVRRDFESGVRAGVVTTPTVFIDGERHSGIPDDTVLARLR